MKFTETKLKGAYLIDIDKLEDHRGFFARSWCVNEFADIGLVNNVLQQNISFSKQKGTMRGMHFQIAPYQETKVLRCTRGRIYDVIIDLRPDSPTYKDWFGAELSAENYRMMFVPKDFAHGFLTLEQDCEVTYLVSEVYTPNSERGIRYNDPEIGIAWPGEVVNISDKDKNWPNFS